MAERKPVVLVGGQLLELPSGDTLPATPPTGSAGGVLSGSFPNPGFAVDMATQGELDAVAAAVAAKLSDAPSDSKTYGRKDAVWIEVIAGGGMPSHTYDQRGSLRASGGQFAVVDGLGLFQHVAGSDEPDDDESCFATATGRWLLQAVHWDVVDAWQAPDDAARDAYDEDEPLRFASSFASSFASRFASSFASRFASKVLTGTATSAITSVAAVTQVNFTGTVTGAAVGDRVIATPPDAVGPRIAAYARVTAANTVTVYLNNPSAAAQTIAAGTWQITVIKS